MKLNYASFVILFVAAIGLFKKVVAQPSNLTLNNSVNSIYVNQLYNLDSNIHTSIRPILTTEFHPQFNNNLGESWWVINRQHDERIADIDKANFKMKIYPLINIMPGFEMEKYSTTNGDMNYRQYNANGFNMNMGIGKKVHIGMNYLYSHSNYNEYFSNSTIEKGGLQGYGIINRSGNSLFNNYLDGYVSYSPTNIFNFQTGMGRNFIGEGYRSMLLSDYAYNYPYFKVSTNIWKIKYVNLYAMQFDMDGEQADFGRVDEKFSSSHYLSVNIGKRLNIGLFETVIWRGQDNTHHRGFDVNYLNPIIFLRPVEYSIGSPDNVLVGLNLSYKVRKWGLLYSQLMLDEFLLSEIRAGDGWWANKYAVQLGFKTHFEKLNVQFEYNLSRPYTYTHSAPSQNYSHFNLPLAHPLGANFKEVVSILRYRHNRFLYEGTLIFGQSGLGNDSSNVGQNIFKSSNTRNNENGNEVLQGNLQEIIYTKLDVSYLLNIKTGMWFNIGVQYRTQAISGIESSKSVAVFAGIKSSIFNRYNEY